MIESWQLRSLGATEITDYSIIIPIVNILFFMLLYYDYLNIFLYCYTVLGWPQYNSPKLEATRDPRGILENMEKWVI